MKLKVGKNLNGDIEVLQAIRAAHPECFLILDANEGYTSTEAIQVLQKLHGKFLTFVNITLLNFTNILTLFTFRTSHSY